MKPAALMLSASLLGLSVLGACQVNPALAPNRQNTALNSLNTATDVNPLRLPLSPSLLQELQQPDQDADARLEDPAQEPNEDYISKVLGTRYVHAHSYYFDHLDNGSSTVESILQHDGHSQAAALVKRWREVLSEGSVWPDRNSTTYQGRFTALEHGQVSDTKGWLRFRNASSKAQEYYQLALKAWKRDLPADHAGQREAWAWLGRTSHFLQDMSVPFHTKTFVRPAQVLYHHPYELTSEVYFDRYLPSQNYNPFGVWQQAGPYPAQGVWGHYYPAGTSAESMIKQLAAESKSFYKLVNHLENSKTGNWEKSRAVLIPLGAKMTSGLVLNYLRDVGALAK